MTTTTLVLQPDPTLLGVAERISEKYGATVLPVREKEFPSSSLKHWLFFVDKPFDQQPWEQATGVAIVCGKNRFRCLDVDQCPPERRDEIVGAILDALGIPQPYPWLVITGTGFHLWFRTEHEVIAEGQRSDRQNVGEWKPWGKSEGAFSRIEFRYDNCYALVPPSAHPNGGVYTFVTDAEPVEAPAEVKYIDLTNALCKVSFYDDGICGGCYQAEENCQCWEREERESEYGYFD